MDDPVQKKVILAVDDAPENLDVVKAALADDYVIKAAINGSIALRIVRKSPPDLVLLDIRMPGMDGFEVLRNLQEDGATRGVPVIFLSAESDGDVKQRSLDLGAAGFVTKPIDSNVLKQAVVATLAGKDG